MGKLAEIKTKPTDTDVHQFIDSIDSEQKKEDSRFILKMMEKATGEKPKIWGKSIIGFGDIRYKSPATGREVDWFNIGFAPRKANITLYMGINVKKHAALLEVLGKHKTGMGCLYINKLADIDTKILEKIIKDAMKK